MSPTFSEFDVNLKSTTRTDGVVYALVANKLATLKELRDDYDCWEALDLYEVYVVSVTNKYLSYKAKQESTRIHR